MMLAMEEVELSLASMSFLVLVHLRLELFEQDLANHFNVSVSTVCRICCTWIRFMYLRYKEISLWLSQILVQ